MMQNIDGKKFGKYFLLIMCAISLILFLDLIKIFIIQIILAIVIGIIVYPVFKIILKVTKNSRNIASFITCLIVLVIVLLPLIFLFNVLVSQISDLYFTFGEKLREIPKNIQQFDSKRLQGIINLVIGKWIPIDAINIDWNILFEDILKLSGLKLASIINKSYKMTLNLMFDFSIIMFSLFYILRDGETLLIKIKTIIPISEEYKDKIIMRFYSMTNATIRGVLLIAILQSFLATLTLWIFDIPNWLVLGLFTLLFSVIPFMGNGIILIPTGIIKILNGNTAEGITIILISVFFISLIDNFLRPRVIGEQTGMHDLLIFFSIIGGIFTFGPVGFIIGPLIVSIFLTILQIYRIEFLTNNNEARK